MRRLRSIQKRNSTAVFLRHFFGCGSWSSLFSFFLFSSFLFPLGSFGQSRPDQPPTYDHLSHKDLPTVTASLSTLSVNSEDLTIAIATDPQGNVYTLSFGKGVDKRDADGNLLDGNFINGLNSPLDIAIDEEGYIYIADFEASGDTYLDNGQIEIYDPNGNYVRSILTSYFRPLGVAVDDEFLYIAEYNDGRQGPESTPSSRVRKINKLTGAVVASNNTVSVPYRIAVNSQGRVYVSKAGGGSAVLILSNELVVQGQLPGIQSPGSIEVDVFDYVHVLEYAGRVDFSRFINFASMGFGEIRNIAEAIDKGIDAEAFGVKIFDSTHNQLSFFKQLVDFPVDIAFNSCDRMYINNGDMFGSNVILIGYVPQKLEFDLEIYQRSPSADITPPIAQCVGNVTIDLAAGETKTLIADNLDNGSYDFCGNVSLQLSKSSFTEADEGSNAVNLTVTDEQGLSSVCQVIVQVNVQDTPDTTDPVFTYCEDQTFPALAGQCGANVNYIIPTATDNGESIAVQRKTGPAPGEFFPVGPTTVTYTATDEAGNSAECSFIIEVEDTQAPVARCISTIPEFTLVNGSVTIVASDIDDGSTDNCDIVSRTLSQDTFTSPGEKEIILSVTDAAGKTDTCTATIRILEESPIFTCLSIYTLLLGEDGTQTLNALDLVEGDTEGVTFQLNRDQFSCADVGIEQSVVLSYTGSATGSCTINIVVQDKIAPVAQCLGNYNITLQPGETKTITAEQFDSGSFDSCSHFDLDLSLSQYTFTAADEGPNSVEFRVEDQSGNVDICRVNVQVTVEGPSFECGFASETLDLDTNCNYPENDFRYLITNRQNFVNGIHIQEIEERNGSTLNVKLKVYHGADVNGDFVGECDYSFTLLDEENPQLQSCDNSPVNLNLPPGEDFIIPDYSGRITYTDNCGEPIIVKQMPGAGTVITENTTVTLAVEDGAGNTSGYCSFIISFQDSPNSISCKFAEVFLGADGNATLDPSAVFDGNANDSEIQKLEVNRESFSCDDIGLQAVELTLTYTDGTTAKCSTQVEVIDDISPNMRCQDIEVTIDPQQGYIIPDYSVELGATDNCDFTYTQVPPPGTVVFESVQIEFIAEDTGGNVVNCYFVLRLNSPEEFAITSCPSSRTEELSNSCNYVLPDYTTEVETTDTPVDIVQSPAPGSIISTTTEVSITATGPSGLSDACTFTVQLEDTTPPAIECPDDILVQIETGGTFVLPDYRDLPGVSDNCSYTVTQQPTAGTVISSEETDINLVVTDAAGLTATCSFKLFLAEDVPLEITCLEDQKGFLGEDCSFVVPDYASMAAVTRPSAQVSQEPAAGSIISGSSTITLTAVEGGETASCTFDLRLLDSLLPEITCREDFQLFLNEEGYGILSAEILLASVTDNCGIESTSLSQTRFETTDVGEQVVIVTVTDINGNVETCETTVTVVPFEQSGGVSCEESITLPLDEDGKAELKLNYSGGNENIELELSKKDFTCDDIGTHTVTATYLGQNTGSCEIDVVVVDRLAPVVSCISEIEVTLDENGRGEISTNDVYVSSSDNCGVEEISLSKSVFAKADIGTQQIELLVSDASGNVESCLINVTVKPYMATGGEFSCVESLTLKLDENGVVVLKAEDLYAGDPEGKNFSGEREFTCNEIGLHTVVLQNRDDPSQNCEVEVEIVDEISPVASCISGYEITLATNGTAIISAEEIGAGSTDNCAIAAMELSRTTFTAADLGEQQITLTVTDGSGNTDTCEATITILPNETVPPAVECVEVITLALDFRGRAELQPNQLFSGGTQDGTYTVDKSGFTCADLGENLVTLTFSTPQEQGSCIVTVIVEDPQNFCGELPEPDPDDLLILYPNPTDGLVKFKVAPGLLIYRIEVFDIRGRFLIEEKYEEIFPPEQYSLDLRGFQAGVYPMMIYTNGKEYLKRVIIE